MNIEIKNVKHSEFASQETHCFEATVYVDGKRSFIASNEGFGGCNNYHPLPKSKATGSTVWDKVKTINEKLKKEKIDVDGTGKYLIENDLDIVISDLVNTYLTLRDYKNKMRRKILAVDEKQQVFSYNASPKQVTPKSLEHLEKRDNVTVLNGKDDSTLKTLLGLK